MPFGWNAGSIESMNMSACCLRSVRTTEMFTGNSQRSTYINSCALLFSQSRFKLFRFRSWSPAHAECKILAIFTLLAMHMAVSSEPAAFSDYLVSLAS